MNTRRWPLLFICLTSLYTGAHAAEVGEISGRWLLDEEASGNISDEMKQLKVEEREFQSEYGGINDDSGRPDPFAPRSKNENWDARRNQGVSNLSTNAKSLLNADSIKVYVSERIIIAYDKRLKRRITPNPNGRVHSATGKGIAKDAVGEILAYLEDDSFVIETRLTTAERLYERFELTRPDRLKLTTRFKSPEWRRTVEYVRYFNRE